MPTGTACRRSCSGGDIYIPRLSLAGVWRQDPRQTGRGLLMRVRQVTRQTGRVLLMRVRQVKRQTGRVLLMRGRQVTRQTGRVLLMRVRQVTRQTGHVLLWNVSAGSLDLLHFSLKMLKNRGFWTYFRSIFFQKNIFSPSFKLSHDTLM